MSTTAKISFEQYEMMVEAGVFSGKHRQRVELIHGELREMTPIGTRHADMVDTLDDWSTENLGRKTVRIRIQQPLALPELESTPQPDVAWVAAKRYRQQHPRAGDVLLLVEVAEESLDYDCGEKAELYAAAGIEDYWVIDLAGESVRVFRNPEGGKYRQTQIFRGDEEVRPLSFPEVVLTPAAVW